MVEREIIPFYIPGGDFWKKFFEDSPVSNYQEISKRLVIAEDWDQFDDMMSKVISTGMFAEIGALPTCSTDEFKYWYKSSEIIDGVYQFTVHLTNKKWPLKKVL